MTDDSKTGGSIQKATIWDQAALAALQGLVGLGLKHGESISTMINSASEIADAFIVERNRRFKGE